MYVLNKRGLNRLLTLLYVLFLLLNLQQMHNVHARNTIMLGYVTGAHPKDENSFYLPPGQSISGAITMAVNDVNSDVTVLPDNELDFRVMETNGLEEKSMLQVVSVKNSNISAVIGPQETCIHEGRLAAAFNRPMISYVSDSAFRSLIYMVIASHTVNIL